MPLRNQVSDEGWADLLQAPPLLMRGVAGVAPQGPIGSAKEHTALVLSLEDLAWEADEPPGGLLGEIRDDVRGLLAEGTSHKARDEALEPDEARYRGVPPGKIAMEGVARAMSACAELAPADTLGYREWLYRVASDIAESATEGGFIRHGPATSAAERALLDEIRAALGLIGES